MRVDILFMVLSEKVNNCFPDGRTLPVGIPLSPYKFLDLQIRE